MCSEEGILHQNPVAGVQKGDKASLFYVSNHCFMSSLPACLAWLLGRPLLRCYEFSGCVNVIFASAAGPPSLPLTACRLVVTPKKLEASYINKSQITSVCYRKKCS